LSESALGADQKLYWRGLLAERHAAVNETVEERKLLVVAVATYLPPGQAISRCLSALAAAWAAAGDW
jgi:hypothetical protein